MPELYFHVRWPDGETQRCYSPSTVIEDYLTTGGVYELGDFLERSRTALGIASERVREKYGFVCTGAFDQLAQIEETAAAYASLDRPEVTVEALSNADGSAR
ncbi:MSMEG_0570 family nitrogen starvation response protein [Streptomyces sp. NPDC087859]|uniref:MSMEG_0570 family nitrogen starvation response protein n=1 Tax=Streptomyces sp. NPDC087859 TaxID=3365812 RepID=UPI00382353A0